MELFWGKSKLTWYIKQRVYLCILGNNIATLQEQLVSSALLREELSGENLSVLDGITADASVHAVSAERKTPTNFYIEMSRNPHYWKIYEFNDTNLE